MKNLKLILIFLIVLFILIVGFIVLIIDYEVINHPAYIGNGKHFGFIRSIDKNTSLYFDDALWLTGTEGENAAILAGLCSEETRNECLPNDFYIQNLLDGIYLARLTSSTTIIMQTYKMEETGQVGPQEINLDEFAELINNQALHWNQLPYNITVLDNEIIKIEEVYIP